MRADFAADVCILTYHGAVLPGGSAVSEVLSTLDRLQTLDLGGNALGDEGSPFTFRPIYWILCVGC